MIFQFLVTLIVVQIASSISRNASHQQPSLKLKALVKQFGTVVEEDISSPSLRVEDAGSSDFTFLEWIDYRDGTCKQNEVRIPLNTCIMWEDDEDTHFARIRITTSWHLLSVISTMQSAPANQ
jgi:hypothetical protein